MTSRLASSARPRAITEEAILAMQRWKPRRMQLATEWAEPLQGGSWPGATLRLSLPFRETLETAFRRMCGPRGASFEQNGKGTWVLELKGGQTGAHRLAQVRGWLETAGRYVALRDWLDQCFALDYDRALGQPGSFRTEVGQLRFHAKPLKDQATAPVRAAAEELVQRCLGFLRDMGSYDDADAVVSAPPAKRGQGWHLPRFLAERIAAERGLTDLTGAIRTVRDRPSTKYRPLAKKLGNIAGSMELDAAAFKHRRVLLMDDIYQSGTTVNYAAKLLYEAGAAAVYGLFCEKTSRDDDNVLARRNA